MSLLNLSRLVVSVASLSFAGVGVLFWIAPERTSMSLGLDAVGIAGLVAMRADLGGLFAGLAILCVVSAWTVERSWTGAAGAVLSCIVVGRGLGWMSVGAAGRSLPELLVELVVLGALAVIGRSSRDADVRSSSSLLKTVALVVGVLLACVGAVMFAPSVQQQLFDRGAEEMSARVNTAPLQDDALRVAVCGSSAPLPSASRAKACVAVFAGGKVYIVDSGPESTENLVLWGIPLSAIDGVFLTHFHSDHVGDLGELHLQTWAGGRKAPLAVYGGPGVERVVNGFNDAYRMDQGYRTEHHGEKVMPSKTWGMVPHTVELEGEPTPALDRTGVALDNGSLRVTAIEVNHAPIAPAYAYRFDYKGRSVVVTGDLKAHPPLARAAKDADVLISEAIAVPMTRSLGTAARGAGRDNTAAIMHDIEDYHITPEEAADIANTAGVKLLVYYHLLPAPDGFLPRRLFSQGVDAVRKGEWTIADDGSLYTLPIGSKDVRIGRVSD